MFDQAEYQALEVPLEPGDRYVLYTDGVLEAANPSQEEYGAERFMKFIANNKQLEAPKFADTVLDELSRWTGQAPEQAQQQDDLTVLVVDYQHR